MMNNEQTEFYKLEDISNWQLNEEKADVGLPPLQRGYVWKPKQVETLWDSLLRGFPIGSFLVSENKSPELKKNLLDGQQKATAIAMGFYNPWEEDKQHPKFFSNKFRNIKETVPVLWLDIAVKEDDEKGDFIFLPRLVTQSHPWGFDRNSTPLGIASRRDANEQFKRNETKYPHYDLKNVYPWDAELPVPLVFLIDAINASIENWQEKVIEKSIEYLSHITVKYSDTAGEPTTYIKKLKETLKDKNICKKIEDGIKTLKQAKIPIIALTNKHLVEESISVIKDATLFVRINTTGTRLEGEELIYSMYKTVFSKSKEIVEAVGAGFIASSRIITLISRIVLTDICIRKKEFKFPNQLNFKQFKNAIKDTEGDFYKGMKQFAENEKSLNVLFNNAKSILIGEKDFQLPVPLAVDIARGNADILFILLYWLHASEINVKIILKNEPLHKKILAAITTLHWFAFNTSKFLTEMAEHELKFGKTEFWNSKLFGGQDDIERYVAFLPKQGILKDILERKINKKSWELVFNEDIEKKNQFLGFFNIINSQRSFLLYAQRQYINDRFKELQWETLIEDTNRPYDWDHIYPDNWWTHNIPNYSTVTQEWRWSIGNFRALALEDNRKEGDRKSPSVRLENSRNESFISDDNWILWRQLDDKINEGQVEILAKAIVHRLVDIYEEWYVKLAVDELFDFENNSSKGST